jgi:hypothetical protein
MATMRCDNRVRFSEQASAKEPMSPRDQLIGRALFRDQVQIAILNLVRGYEATTGLTVTRLDYDAREGRVHIEALPL